jgi:TRAP-type C4-dicarboxylate transport system permease small subunit
MAVLLSIWAVVSILNLVLFVAAVNDAEEKFHKRYPELEIPKTSTISRFSSWLRIIVSAMLPIIQLMIFWVLLFRYTSIIDVTIRKVYLEAMEEKRNAQKNSDISDSSEVET